MISLTKMISKLRKNYSRLLVKFIFTSILNNIIELNYVV
jgi:hypothetical protein